MRLQTKGSEIKIIKLLDDNGITLLNPVAGNTDIVLDKTIVDMYLMNNRRVLVIEPIKLSIENLYYKNRESLEHYIKLILATRENYANELKNIRENIGNNNTLLFINNIEFFWKKKKKLFKNKYIKDRVTGELILLLQSLEKTNNTAILKTTDIEFLESDKFLEILKYKSMSVNYNKI